MGELIIDEAVLAQYHAAGFDIVEADATFVKACNLIGERDQSLGLIAELETTFDADFIQFIERTALLRWRT